MNKTTDHFKRTIQAYLDNRAAEDKLFAANYNKPNKNIEDCVTYILNWVQKSGCNGFTDGEIYSQAVHYYDEDDIEVGKPLQCQVVVNHTVELTDEEKAEARQQAIRQYQAEELRKLQNRNKAKASQKTNVQQVELSLFRTYETKDIHTERNHPFERKPARTDRRTENLRFPALLQALRQTDGKRYHHLHGVRTRMEKRTQPCRHPLRMLLPELRNGIGNRGHPKEGVHG